MMPEIDHIPGPVVAGSFEVSAHLSYRITASKLSGRTGVVSGTSQPRASSEPDSGADPAFQVGTPRIPPGRTWPLQSYLELGALPSAVPCARLHGRQVLWEWDPARPNDPAEVVVSELITNAVQAMADWVVPRPIRLWLSSDHSRVHIAVWDAEPTSPQPKPVAVDGVPDWSDDGGRGLFLVASLSQRWGWNATPQWGGKVVWAEVAA